MNVTENPDAIVIRHTPIKKWIFGGFLGLTFGGFFVWFVFSIVAGSQFYSLLILIFSMVAATLVLLEIYFFPLVFAPEVSITVNRKAGSVDILSQRIYGSKMERFFFHQVQKFKSHKGNTRFSPAYSLALILANRKILKLEIPIAADKNEAVKFIKKLNRFIKQPKH